ncbi:urea ABC transporter permease subunit UrtB [Psychrobacter glacincola]|uniref:urea ABC transporter permease subunit UrtB n=1 Tax=Psychrobacter TaxID=497 RepID=UPI0019183075|nr:MULTISPECIES: urea ABC transporter permease subunit UrtB [unclassified Psychrobacter]
MSHYSSYYKSDAQANYFNKTFIIALLSLLLLIAITSPAHAHETSAVHSHGEKLSTNTVAATSNAVSEETLLAQDDTLLAQNKQSLTTSADLAISKGDAIEQFVAADFTIRQTMLNQWPGSVESLDTLVELIKNDELYQGNGGQTYLLNSEDELFTYPAKQLTTEWPSDLAQVTLTNTLRSALVFGQAKVKLESNDPTQRVQAVAILADNIEQLDPVLISTAAANEQDDDVKTALSILQARIDFRDGDVTKQIAALTVLADSDSPQVLVDVKKALAADDIDPVLKSALLDAEDSIEQRITISTWIGHLFTGLSTASILLLAALGLAITFGLLGVINMAHGELIMIGAYATYMVQNLFQAYFPSMTGWYLVAAIPVAFLVSAIIGMVIERIIIRPLYGRELETLLATFGVSLILMQLVRMIFGAQNVEVSNVDWLSGAYQVSSSLVLPFNRIAIIGFTIIILMLLVYLLNKTRFGLFVRAVTQNRQMARAVGISSARIDMLAFGLGSGLAGLAGCALAQVGNVGPDLGQTYIIDAFLVVVVGGVGQVWGAVLASLGLGVSGTVLEIGIGAVMAKIVLLVLVILFIQKRPQGLFALKGRFVD